MTIPVLGLVLLFQQPRWNEVGGRFEGWWSVATPTALRVRVSDPKGIRKQVRVRLFGLRPSSQRKIRSAAIARLKEPASSDRLASELDFRVHKVDTDGTLAVYVTYWIRTGINAPEPGEIDEMDMTMSLLWAGLAKLHAVEIKSLPSERQTELREAELLARQQGLGMWSGKGLEPASRQRRTGTRASRMWDCVPGVHNNPRSARE